MQVFCLAAILFLHSCLTLLLFVAGLHVMPRQISRAVFLFEFVAFHYIAAHQPWSLDISHDSWSNQAC
jgi:hypothetical protein